MRLENEAPLCVFADSMERGKALFLKDVHGQKLLANSNVMFGTFPPGCLSEECDAIPTHTCSVDREANTLVVHSLLSFEHEPGSSCTKGCQPVIAGCESGVLEAGKYRIEYGRRTFHLTVPSVMRDPCFKRE